MFGHGFTGTRVGTMALKDMRVRNVDALLAFLFAYSVKHVILSMVSVRDHKWTMNS